MKLKVNLIRHGKTRENFNTKFLGKDNSGVCEEGKQEILKNIKSNIYPKVDFIYSSPMKRCLETKKIIYGDQSFKEIQDLRECYFGKLKDNISKSELYKIWILAEYKKFDEIGETVEEFKKRVYSVFQLIIEDSVKNEYYEIAVFSHGMLIMVLLEKYMKDNKIFYDWKVENGSLHVIEITLGE